MAIRLHTIKCPNCNAPIDLRTQKNIMFCPFCGTQLLLEDTNTKTINIHKREEKTITNNINYSQTDYARIVEAKEGNKGILLAILAPLSMFLLAAIIGVYSDFKDKQREEQLNELVEEVQENIKEEDYLSARVNANRIVVTWTNKDEVVSKWDGVRETLLEEINRATGEDVPLPVTDQGIASNTGNNEQETEDFTCSLSVYLQDERLLNVKDIPFNSKTIHGSFNGVAFEYLDSWTYLDDSDNDELKHFLVSDESMLTIRSLIINSEQDISDPWSILDRIYASAKEDSQKKGAIWDEYRTILVNDSPAIIYLTKNDKAEFISVLNYVDDRIILWSQYGIWNGLDENAWKDYLAFLASSTPDNSSQNS